jgi:nifR3 family TIM-barrel protein
MRGMSLFRPFRLGPLELGSNLFLAPLAGYTSLAFRLVVRRIGRDARGVSPVALATTEVVSAKALAARNRRTLDLLRTDPGDRPLAVQINAASAEDAREAALVAESLGAAAVDLNLGCPVRKVARKGGGAALARSADEAAAVARAVVAAVRVPVTAKLRLGWAERDLTAPDLVRALEAAGVAAVAVHGRRRAQGFGGAVDLAGVRAVVAAARSIPVLGNGDIASPEAARAMLEETGCAGLLVGRAAVVNPWIFAEIRDFLETGRRRPPPAVEERLAVLAEEFALHARHVGERPACLELRKVFRLYARALGAGETGHAAAGEVACAADVAELLELLRAAASARPGLVLAGAAVPVPKGPVDLW